MLNRRGRWTIAGAVFALALTVAPVAQAQDTAYHFGFKKSRNEQPASINEEGFKETMDKYGAVFRIDETEKSLYLTFDNGYENGYTSRILDVLKEKQVPAVFFVTGHYIETQGELLRRMKEEGHIIGNHSWSHPDMTTISDERIATELQRVKEQTAQVAGQQEMSLLRPPRGIFSDRTLRVSRELGYTNVFWSVAYVDWDVKQQRGAAYAHEKVVSQLHPGAIILLHAISSDNAAAMGSIIDAARAKGYEFKRLDERLSNNI